MPGTIFDAHAAEAARREAAYERMFDEMRMLVKKPARSRKKPVSARTTGSKRDTGDRRLDVTLVNAQTHELRDIERQYVLEHDRWMAHL
jgi:hypothetical protein